MGLRGTRYQGSGENYIMRTLVMTWVGHVAPMGERRNVYRVLVRKPEGKRPHGRPRPRWEDYITMDLQKVGGGARNRSSWLRIGTGGGHL